MPYAVYKLTHLLGIFVLLITLALPFMHLIRGGTRADFPHRRALALTHGAASFLILLGGFGMLARLGVVQGGLPNWILVKLTIWLVLSFALSLALRTTAGARAVLVAAPLLALLAAGMAIYKPFQARDTPASESTSVDPSGAEYGLLPGAASPGRRVVDADHGG